MELTPADLLLVKNAFRQYYKVNASVIPVPTQIQSREFGFQSFEAGWTRHIRLADGSALKHFLATSPASSYYCSVSHYDEPSSTPMESKKWKGADFVFDIDAKDLAMDCREDHTVHVCNRCGRTARTQSMCCGSRRKTVSLPCGKCIAEARCHTDSLTKLLLDDAGMDPATIKTYFSGHEGYHIHVTDHMFHHIESDGRNHLTRYILHHGICVDAGVTTDISRIFRMPGTLSAKSGMAKTECADPFQEAVVLDNAPTTVQADCSVSFALKGLKFGPYATEQVDIPAYAAAYMILKGLAHAV